MTSFDFFYDMKSSMIWTLTLKQMVEEKLILFKTFLTNEEAKSQRKFTMYFYQVTQRVLTSPASSFICSISSTSVTPETARQTPPHPLSQPTQYEDWDEDLYDDPLSPNA